MSIARDSKKNFDERPIFCPYCNALHLKRGAIKVEIKKNKYFLTQCWRCYGEFIIDSRWHIKAVLDKFGNL